jgi:uncharacterized protein YjbI with pentapeptide repeats
MWRTLGGAVPVLLLVTLHGVGTPFVTSPNSAAPQEAPRPEGTSPQCPVGAEATAAEFTSIIAGGLASECEGVTIRGDLDLRSLKEVPDGVQCLDCVLEGSLLARGVTFEGIVDLRGIQISGRLDMRGAEFRKALLMDSTATQVMKIGGVADLSLAEFEGTVQFDGAEFAGPVRFVSSTFTRSASFDRASFLGATDFSGATFEGDLRFSGGLGGSQAPEEGTCAEAEALEGRLCGAAIFDHAKFEGLSDFRQRFFGGQTDFEGAVFQAKADFSRSRFAGRASFESAQFAGGASFGGDIFSQETEFLWGTGDKIVEFSGATFVGDVTFFGFASTDTLDMRDVVFGGKRIDLTQVTAKDFRMGLPVVAGSRTAEVEHRFLGLSGVLDLVERTARERGDLLLANEAKFQLLALQGENLTSGQWIADRFRRVVLGYLVRPSVPLVNLAGLVLVAAVIRSLRRLRAWACQARQSESAKGVSTGDPQAGRQARSLTIAKGLAGLLGSVWRTLGVAARPGPGPEMKVEDPSSVASYALATMRWAEFLTYKLLEAAFFISLGNANPTARQLIDAVIKGGKP